MTAFCCRCKEEDFPMISTGGFRMGQLTDISQLSKRSPVYQYVADWRDHEDGHYLCGNCYFDLTDDDD